MSLSTVDRLIGLPPEPRSVPVEWWDCDDPARRRLLRAERYRDQVQGSLDQLVIASDAIDRAIKGGSFTLWKERRSLDRAIKEHVHQLADAEHQVRVARTDILVPMVVRS